MKLSLSAQIYYAHRHLAARMPRVLYYSSGSAKAIVENRLIVIQLYVQAAIALHNLLRTTESTVYCPPGFIDAEDGSGNSIDGGWRNEENNSGMQPIGQASSNR